MRQLVYTALKVRFAAPNLAFMITSGYTDAFEIIRPRYLNFYTVSICYLHTYIYPLQFTNIAFVLPMLISRLLLAQKRVKQFISSYSSSGEGAIRTKLSANASRNNYREAIVYSCLFPLSMLHYW